MKVDRSSQAAEVFDHQENITKISDIPLEVLEIIFSFLKDGASLNAITLVRHDWSAVSITVIKKTAFSILKDFANFLSDNLKEVHIFQKEILYHVKNDRKILGSVNFSEIKTFCDDLKNQILFTLKELSEDELKELENVAVLNEKIPKFFNVFELIKQERVLHRKKLEEINGESDPTEKQKNLKKFVNKLLRENEIHLALESAVKASDSTKPFLYKKISRGFFEKSKVINEKISTLVERDVEAKILKNEYVTLVEKGEMTQEMFEKLEKQLEEKSEILKRELEVLNKVYQNLIHQALEVVRVIQESFVGVGPEQFSAYVYLVKGLVEIERFDTLSSFGSASLSAMPLVWKKAIIELIEEEKFIHAMKLVDMLTFSSRENDLQEIAMLLMDKGQFFLAKEVVHKLARDADKFYFFAEIIRREMENQLK